MPDAQYGISASFVFELNANTGRAAFLGRVGCR